VGGGEGLPLLIENFIEHVSRTVSHAQTDIQSPQRKFLPKLKIIKDIDLALYLASLGIVSM
jgi:hypothetical protein